MKRMGAFLAAMLVLPLFACVVSITFPKIDRHPPVADYRPMFAPRTFIPHFDPGSTKGWQVDLRSTNLTAVDARGSLSDLLYADFDDDTLWPAANRMPKGFDAKAIMELGKDPGLGVRTLHARGITGKDVGIAIIDQPLLVDHVEYASRLRLYEERNITQGVPAQMHAPAVSSIAVGRSVGVAPGADLYEIADDPGTWTGPDGFTYDFTYTAKSIRRILEINKGLPHDRKIRVISISVGWSSEQAGFTEVTAAVKDATAAGVFVCSCSLEQTHGFKFHALGRPPMADPNRFESYEPGLWLASQFYADSGTGGGIAGRLMIPMDSRTTASPTGTSKYVFYREGGWSWCIPYIAGVYALACQVDPSVTPDIFWQTAMKTGKTIQIQHDGKSYPLGPIIDPVAIVGALSH